MKKAVVLVIVWGLTIIVAILAIGAIYLMGNQAYVAEHKIRRILAYYTAKAGMVYALEDLRTTGTVDPSQIQLIQGSRNLTAVITTTSGCPTLADDFSGCQTLSITVDY